MGCSGAGDGIRTRGYQLGKLGPYHLATPACMEILSQLHFSWLGHLRARKSLPSLPSAGHIPKRTRRQSRATVVQADERFLPASIAKVFLPAILARHHTDEEARDVLEAQGTTLAPSTRSQRRSALRTATRGAAWRRHLEGRASLRPWACRTNEPFLRTAAERAAHARNQTCVASVCRSAASCRYASTCACCLQLYDGPGNQRHRSKDRDAQHGIPSSA